jgi:hypothetical protein
MITLVVAALSLLQPSDVWGTADVHYRVNSRRSFTTSFTLPPAIKGVVPEWPAKVISDCWDVLVLGVEQLSTPERHLRVHLRVSPTHLPESCTVKLWDKKGNQLGSLKFTLDRLHSASKKK